MFQVTKSLIFDLGSNGIKFGKENDSDFSLLEFDKEFQTYDEYQQAKQKQGIQNGQISSIIKLEKSFEEILNFLYEENISQENLPPLVIADSLNNPPSIKRETIQICFEQTGFSLINIMHQVVCSLFGHGLTNGLVMDFGYGHSQMANIQQGLVLSHFVNENINNQQIEKSLIENFQNKYKFFSNQKFQEFFQDLNNKREIFLFDQIKKQQTLELPDGQRVFLDQLQNIINQTFFDKQQIVKQVKEIQEKQKNLINKNRLKIHLTGGCVELDELQTKLIENLEEQIVNCQFIVNKKPSKSSFKGAQAFAQLPINDSMYITKAQYLENGDNILNRKALSFPNYF